MSKIINPIMAEKLKKSINDQHLTVHAFRSSLPKAPADHMPRTADGKVDLTKRKPIVMNAEAATAMGDIASNAAAVAKGKAENYSAEVTAELLKAYTDSDKSDIVVKDLAVRFGKSARSIVAKLSKEGVYKKKEYVTKTGGKPVSKEEHVQTIAAFMAVEADKLESLEKANKNVLVLVEAALKRQVQDHDNTNPQVVEMPEDKATKAELLTTIATGIGCEQSELKSLLLASKEALQLVSSVF